MASAEHQVEGIVELRDHEGGGAEDAAMLRRGSSTSSPAKP